MGLHGPPVRPLFTSCCMLRVRFFRLGSEQRVHLDGEGTPLVQNAGRYAVENDRGEARDALSRSRQLSQSHCRDHQSGPRILPADWLLSLEVVAVHSFGTKVAAHLGSITFLGRTIAPRSLHAARFDRLEFLHNGTLMQDDLSDCSTLSVTNSKYTWQLHYCTFEVLILHDNATIQSEKKSSGVRDCQDPRGFFGAPHVSSPCFFFF